MPAYFRHRAASGQGLGNVLGYFEGGADCAGLPAGSALFGDVCRPPNSPKGEGAFNSRSLGCARGWWCRRFEKRAHPRGTVRGGESRIPNEHTRSRLRRPAPCLLQSRVCQEHGRQQAFLRRRHAVSLISHACAFLKTPQRAHLACSRMRASARLASGMPGQSIARGRGSPSASSVTP